MDFARLQGKTMLKVKALDPYETLSVARDATEAQIRSVYRRMAKTHHPDAGGDPAAWERLQQCYNVLMDPALRKTFDETGRIEEDRPDNDRAAALQVIEMHFGQMLNEYLLGGLAAALDPRKRDVPKAIAAKINAEVLQAEDAMLQGKNVLKFFQDMKGRIKLKDATKVGEDFLSRQLEIQIKNTDEQIRGLEGNVRVRKMALDIVKGYEFRQDDPYVKTDGGIYMGAGTTAYTWSHPI